MEEREAKNVLDADGEPIESPSLINRMGWTGKSADVRIKGGVGPAVGTQPALFAPIDERHRQYLERRCHHG